MPRINVLPKNIADLIAAGEVVERPSSVIKEFVENSIDAGAAKITVEIQNGGKTYMRVTDDGCGIEREDVRKAFISHATSKITAVEDLDSISTLGFRGEALASVCAVSKVDLMTSSADSDIGTRYVIEGGEEKYLDDVGSPVGTTLVVRDLFYNIPARLKFLKKDVQEGNYVASVLERIAVSNPDISFKFIRDGKIVFQTPGDGNLKSAVYAVFGKEFTSQLLAVRSEMNGIKIHGFISKPTACKGSRAMQTYFVNGRYVKSAVFLTALENAYKNSVMVGRYPACVLFADMPFETVDVNVHPAKTEVRFFDEKRVFEAVYNSVLSALNADNSRLQVSFSEAKVFTEPTQKGEQLKIKDITSNSFETPKIETPKTETPKRIFSVKEFGIPVTGEENMLRSSQNSEPKQLDFLSDSYYKPNVKVIYGSGFDEPKNEQLEENCANIREESGAIHDETLSAVGSVPQKSDNGDVVSHESVSSLPEYRYIGEVFNTYLIAETDDTVIFIDKHAAHERILFEKFKKQGSNESQIMLSPVSVNLSADEYSAVIENLGLLTDAGYDVTDFGDRCIKISACPPELVGENISEIMTEIASYLAKNIKSLMPEKLDWIYHSMACRAAIKAGNFTSSYEAEKFVGVLLADSSIRYCPHGRPVLIEMTKREIEKQFGRIV